MFQVANAIKASLPQGAMKSSKEGTRCIQVEITPTSSRISRNAVTSMSIRGHRWKRHGKKHILQWIINFLQMFKITLRILLLHIFIASKQAAVCRFLFSWLVNRNLNAVQMKCILYFLNRVFLRKNNPQKNPKNQNPPNPHKTPFC